MLAPASADFHGKRSRSRSASRRARFSARDREWTALAKMWSREARNRFGLKERAGVGPAFLSSVPGFVARMERSEIRERHRRLHRPPGLRFALSGLRRKRRKRNAGKRRVTTAASCDAARALLERARLTAFHRGSRLRELFHPKGSASGQASWDAVCTGVTRLRLSQSRDAPPAPVVMPGDMMPKPPGSRLQTHPRAPPSLP